MDKADFTLQLTLEALKNGYIGIVKNNNSWAVDNEGTATAIANFYNTIKANLKN